jgi:diguanylate cyclase (GGDEF)-like protein
LSETKKQYDIFIAYASHDQVIARNLYSALKISYRVFMASESLTAGDSWPVAISLAQQHSLLTVVLISAHSEAAYYQREEILHAVDLARDGKTHRVVPVYLSGKIPQRVPYGLRQLHAIRFRSNSSLLELATKMEAALKLCKKEERQVRPVARSSKKDNPSPELSSRISHRAREVRDAELKAEAMSSLKKNLFQVGRPEICSLIYVDLDDFSAINKRYDIYIGERVIDIVVTLLEGLQGYRWGGDEFIVSLPEVELVEAYSLAETLRRDIESYPWSELAFGLRVSASFGVAELGEEETIDHCLLRAICGVEEAKKKGKNHAAKGPLALPLNINPDVFSYGS